MRQRELTDCVQVRQLRCQLSFLTERTESLAKNQMICDNIPLSDQDLINETKRLSLEEEKLHSLVGTLFQCWSFSFTFVYLIYRT